MLTQRASEGFSGPRLRVGLASDTKDAHPLSAPVGTGLAVPLLNPPPKLPLVPVIGRYPIDSV